MTIAIGTPVTIHAHVNDEDRDGFYWIRLSDSNQVRAHESTFTKDENNTKLINDDWIITDEDYRDIMR